MVSLWQGQQQAKRATTLAQQWSICLCINNSNNAIVTRATIAIATMAKTPAHWRQWCHLDEGDDNSLTTRNEGNNASLMMAETPLHQWWQWLHHNNGKDACNNKRAYPGTKAQPNSQDACGIGSLAFAALGWAKGWFGIDWVEINWSPLNQFHLNLFLRFYPPKLLLSLVSSSPNCPH